MILQKEMTMDTALRFNQRIYRASVLYNIGIGILTSVYVMLFVNPRPAQIHLGCAISVIMTLINELLLSPFFNTLLCRKLSQRVEGWTTKGLSSIEARTELYEDLMFFPIQKGIQTFMSFLSGSVIIIVLTHFISIFSFPISVCLLALAPSIMGSIISSLLTVSNTEKICMEMAEKLVNEGVDKDYIYNKKSFGIPLPLRTFLYLFNPALCSTILTVLILISSCLEINGYKPVTSILILKISTITVFNLAACINFCIQYYKYIMKNNNKLKITLEEVLDSGKVTDSSSTNIGDQLQYNIYLFNNIVQRFQNMIQKASAIGENVRKTTDDLTDISRQLSTTSVEQSANIKEILTTMEDSNEFSQNIAGRISQVSLGTDVTKENVEAGFGVLNENISQMSQIKDANDEIIKGIENLTQQINNIDSIITIIKDIADQTRIIAFNAELEAVSAGEEGKNFHIVATEIRRLANSTMSSINEIQKYITTVKKAASDLIQSSENGTTFIEEEAQTVKNLESHFNSIKESAEETSSKTSEISTIVQQQTNSFTQIIITLRQISSSIENFTQSTGTISTISTELQNIAQKLENIKDRKIS